jgi:hypothetical protein
MAPVTLCFIISRPTALSKTDQQRQRFRALSHAAIVSHNRRNLGSGDLIQVKATGGTKTSTRPQKLTQHQVDSKQKESDNPHMPTWKPHSTKVSCPGCSPLNSSHHLRNAPSSEPTLYEELDPFLRPALPLSRHERNILHHCEAPELKLAKRSD